MSKSIFDGTLTATPNNTGDIRLCAIVGWGNEPCILRIESCFENGKYNGITDNAQTAFCRKYNSTMPYEASSNIYISDLGHGDGAQKALSVTSGQQELKLILGLGQGYDWEEMYYGALSKAKNKESYLLNGTFYTLKDCEVTFNLEYPVGWSDLDVYADDRSVLYMGADNKLYYPSVGMNMGSCRALFKLVGITVGDLETGTSNAIILNFGDDTKGIEEVLPLNPQITTHDPELSNLPWFTLDGRRLQAQPTQSGIYIQGGHKVVIQ